ncbi:Hypothetical protein, putative [Bodo saltans]|uniref:ubiquitinyl hydrolase 1 n=1 Tax=Bodo saltans TaxID=75058 RepID=A0A0S4IXL6_BODSA|nr:Hypothetical protein, putative [Bodo saltans]|eukprot:CUF60804.1 Hypothetical protein, putative [Bodo saltans]
MIPGARIVAPKGRRKPCSGPANDSVTQRSAGGESPQSQQLQKASVERTPAARAQPKHRDPQTMTPQPPAGSTVQRLHQTAPDLTEWEQLVHVVHGKTELAAHDQQVEAKMKKLLLAPSTGQGSSSALLLQPRGLINASYHCFLNAVTQSVTSLAPFLRLAEQLSSRKELAPTWSVFGKWVEQSRTSNANAAIRGGGCVAGPRIPFLAAPTTQRGAAAVLSTRRTHFDGRTQQDAHEFLSFLLETLREELCAAEEETYNAQAAAAAASAEPPVQRGSQKKQAASQSCEEEDTEKKGKWTTVGKGNEKLQVTQSGLHVDDLAKGGNDMIWRIVFGGELHNLVRGGKSTVRGVTSVTKEPFFTIALPVEIPSASKVRKDGSGGPPTVSELLESTFGVKESIDDDVRHCEVSRAQQIGALPHILILQLKRWAVTAEGDVVKLDNVVRIPVDLTIPQSTCSVAITGSGRGGGYRQYALQSVVCHRGGGADTSASGRSAGGHYVSYVTRGKQQAARDDSGPYWLCNDMKISTASHSTMEADTPYLLFYQRR